jgi:hypothetical protein
MDRASGSPLFATVSIIRARRARAFGPFQPPVAAILALLGSTPFAADQSFRLVPKMRSAPVNTS